MGGPHHGGQVLCGPVGGERVAAHQHQCRLRAGFGDGAQQRLLALGQVDVRAVLGLAAVDHRMVAEDDDRDVRRLGRRPRLGGAVAHQLALPAFGVVRGLGGDADPAVGRVHGGVAPGEHGAQ